MRPPGLRILYSFPHKIGATRICTIAWHHVKGLADTGCAVLLFTGSVHRPLPPLVQVHTTLARGPLRIPYRLLGRIRACSLHDYLVARALPTLARDIDIVHTWPLAARRTLRKARQLGIPTVLERPNAHTRYAFHVVQQECHRLGIALPRTHEHAYNAEVLRIEEEEYQLADGLLCPSDFVVRTFLDEGYPSDRLLGHLYGYDDTRFFPAVSPRSRSPFTVLFAGVCAVRKGLHHALTAWLQSPAHRHGRFLIAGQFLPAYYRLLTPLLQHPSVTVLGLRTDIPELMRSSDALVLPSLEEGFPLVCAEAMGSGCVPLVSTVCSGVCVHMENSLLHRVADTAALAEHFTLLSTNPDVRRRLRAGALATASHLTWRLAAVRLAATYRHVLRCHSADDAALGTRISSS